ncbi:MAG: hypothetical protein ACRDG7_11435 [Candidatus Limnocylindria bacterium]
MTRILEIDPAWRRRHPGAAVGVLAVRGVTNPPIHAGLNDLAAALEADIRARLGKLERNALRATPPLPAYATYYKRWGQRYHVAMQLESVAQKGRPLPRSAALVEAMFIAELRNGLLTAGHDLDALVLPVRLAAGNGERYRGPSGAELAVKTDDMFIADAQRRILSAIVTGPSDFARITSATTSALFHVYAPPGVDVTRLAAHLDEIERNVRLISPTAAVAGRDIASAS